MNRNSVIRGAQFPTPAKTCQEHELDGYLKAIHRKKRIFDIVLIVASHLLFLPLWLLLWTCIPLIVWLEDRGPVFYLQERLGKGGQRFQIIKFRTMVRNAEAHTGQVWAREDDERITRAGRILRHLRLDEMPQIINVLKGDMSLVGPRPERPFLAERISRHVPGFSRRLQVLPGIAGLAQWRGGYSVPPRHKLRYDLLYIKRMNLWLDARLLVLSFFFVIKHSLTRMSKQQD